MEKKEGKPEQQVSIFALNEWEPSTQWRQKIDMQFGMYTYTYSYIYSYVYIENRYAVPYVYV